jgi:hypothetical protein
MIFNIEVGMKNVTASLDSSFPADVTVTAGGEATFKVVVTDEGIPKEHTFQWFVNDTAIEGATEDTYVRDTSGDKGVISIWCEVTNKAGTTISRHAALTVKKTPVLNASYPQNANVSVGTTVTFEAKIAEAGYPNSNKYQWYKNGVAVAGATGSSYSYTPYLEGTETVYCKVTNDVGTVTTRTATLTANRIYLYKNGDTCDAVSGGWVAAKAYEGCADSYVDGFHLNADHILIQGKYNRYIGGCGTAGAPDLSKSTRLNALVYSDAGTGNARMCVTGGLYNFFDHVAVQAILPNGSHTISLDISGVYQAHVCFSSDTATAAIHAVWLG